MLGLKFFNRHAINCSPKASAFLCQCQADWIATSRVCGRRRHRPRRALSEKTIYGAISSSVEISLRRARRRSVGSASSPTRGRWSSPASSRSRSISHGGRGEALRLDARRLTVKANASSSTSPARGPSPTTGYCPLRGGQITATAKLADDVLMRPTDSLDSSHRSGSSSRCIWRMRPCCRHGARRR